MALDRNGTGSSQGASGNQRGGSGEGSRGGGGGRDRNTNNNTNKKTGTVSQRVKSVASAAKTIASRPAATQTTKLAANVGMTEVEQRAAYAVGAEDARARGILGNLMSKVKSGAATEKERSQLAQVADSANRHSAATVAGGTVAGSLGSYLGNGLASLADDGSYYSGLGAKIGTGEMKGVLGSINDKLGQGGFSDSALGAVASAASAAVPGAGLMFNALSRGLSAPNATAIAEINRALGLDVGVTSKSSDSGYNRSDSKLSSGLAKTGVTSTPATTVQDNGYRYDPTKYQFKSGARAATPWSYN